MANERRKKQEEGGGGAPEWMTTYSDLVTLLLTFFILLFSMATLDAQKMKEVSFSLKQALLKTKAGGDTFQSNRGQSVVTVNITNPEDTGVLRVDSKKYTREKQSMKILDEEERLLQSRIEETKLELKERIEAMGMGEYVEIIEERNLLITRIKSEILFESGSADLKPEGEVVLLKLSEPLITFEEEITVHGHTDNRPINTQLYPTNWELSTKRATNVVRFLVDKGSIKAERLTATGNGEYKPIESNDTPEGRARNRRIELSMMTIDWQNLGGYMGEKETIGQ